MISKEFFLKTATKNKIIILTMTLIALGVLIDLSLNSEYFMIQSMKYDATGICGKLGGYFECESVFFSDYSKIFNVPVSIFSLLYLLVLFFLISNYYLLEFENKEILLGLSFLLSFFVVVYHSFLILILLVEIRTFCLFCLIVYIINVLLFSLLMLINDRPGKFILSFYNKITSLMLIIKNKGSDNRTKQKLNSYLSLIFSLELIISFFFTFFTYIYFSTKYPPYVLTKNEINHRFKSAETFDLSIENSNLLCSRGADSAPTKIYYFFDYNCQFCRKTSKSLDQVYGVYKDKIQIFYIPFPLDNKCNPLAKSKNDNSCVLSNTTLWSGKHGKFSEAYPEIMNLKLKNVEYQYDDLLERFGFLKTNSNNRINVSDYKSSYEFKLAQELKVDSVPTVFINNKKIVGNLHPKFLIHIIEAVSFTK